ncbi:SDR family oxidoreductase [Streptomyces sp. NBC_01218]|uniref:SDR family oxidoreductase n=1 Tax=unclassified Streptomyces TaxID=2593676 RepID=UPI002E0FC212|nr:SDR family oxidoreductase [Streptomyces sp. NBC_01218]
MRDRNPLEGRLAVVTGAARGVGAQVAKELAHRGVRVALLGREANTLARVAATLETDAHCFEVDVTDDAAMRDAAEEISARLGPPSVVVANAGVAEGGPFGTSDPVSWRRVVEVNLIGSAITARTFLPGLLATRGYFLQIASTASFGAAPMMSAYCASKAGVESLAQSLRAELAHRGVGVGVAYLSWTGTDMIRDADRYDVLRELRGHMPPPARRVHPVEQVAGWLVRGIERRSPTVYAPPWLRLAQPVRPYLPAVVTWVSRRQLPRLEERARFEATGLLGAGGRAAARREAEEA